MLATALITKAALVMLTKRMVRFPHIWSTKDHHPTPHTHAIMDQSKALFCEGYCEIWLEYVNAVPLVGYGLWTLHVSSIGVYPHIYCSSRSQKTSNQKKDVPKDCCKSTLVWQKLHNSQATTHFTLHSHKQTGDWWNLQLSKIWVASSVCTPGK